MAKKRPKKGTILITESDFFGNYKPRINHIERINQSKDVADEDLCSWSGCMYETYGRELEFVALVANDPKTRNKVWTLVEGDDEETIIAGFHLVNRMGYFITKKPWATEEQQVEMEKIDRDDEGNIIS